MLWVPDGTVRVNGGEPDGRPDRAGWRDAGEVGLSGWFQAVRERGRTGMLAELIENATTFSRPDTTVTVATTGAANGHVVEIEDKGTGMSDDQLAGANQILADPPAVDSALSQRLGLHVVARLAKRHDIRVQLRHSWYGGVTALVLLPAHLLARPSDQTGTAVREAGQVTHHVRSPVPQAAAVAVMPPPLGGTGQPASARQLPLRGHAPQPASQGPVPSHELRGTQEQWWQPEPPPNSDEANAPPTSGGLPLRIRRATRALRPVGRPPRATEWGDSAGSDRPPQHGPPEDRPPPGP